MTMSSITAALESPATEFIRFLATDVTGTHQLEVADLQRTLPVFQAAQTLASRMSLPDNVPWALRDESTSAYLDDKAAIGDQIAPNARVSITPRTHLG